LDVAWWWVLRGGRRPGIPMSEQWRGRDERY